MPTPMTMPTSPTATCTHPRVRRELDRLAAKRRRGQREHDHDTQEATGNRPVHARDERDGDADGKRDEGSERRHVAMLT